MYTKHRLNMIKHILLCCYFTKLKKNYKIILLFRSIKKLKHYKVFYHAIIYTTVDRQTKNPIHEIN
jgi:hypothetical protein